MLSVWLGAAQRGDMVVINELLQSYVRKTAGNGDTALMIAAKNGHADICRLLSSHEAGMRNSEGMTALMMAAIANSAELCEILAPFEWPVTLENGKDALILAAELGNTYSLTVLTSHADLIKDLSGNTALDYAAMYDNIACLRTLAETQKLSLAQIDSAIEKAEQSKSTYTINYLVDLRLSTKAKATAKNDTESKIKELERAVASLQLCFTEKMLRDSTNSMSDALVSHNLPPRMQPTLSRIVAKSDDSIIIRELIEENEKLHKRLSATTELINNTTSQSQFVRESDTVKEHALVAELESATTIMREYESRIASLMKTLQERDSTIIQLRTTQLRLIAADPITVEAQLFAPAPDHELLQLSTKGSKLSKTPDTPLKRAFSNAKKSLGGAGKEGRSRSRPGSVKKLAFPSDHSFHTTSFESDSADIVMSQSRGPPSRLGTLIDNLKLTVSEHESIQACLQAQSDEIERLTQELRGYHDINLASNTASLKHIGVQTTLSTQALSTCSQQTELDMELFDYLLLNMNASDSEEKKITNVWNVMFRKTLELPSDNSRNAVIRNLLITFNNMLTHGHMNVTFPPTDIESWDSDKCLPSQWIKENMKSLPLLACLPETYSEFLSFVEQYMQVLENRLRKNNSHSIDVDEEDSSPYMSSFRGRVKFSKLEVTFPEEQLAHAVSMPDIMPDYAQESYPIVSNLRPNTPTSVYNQNPSPNSSINISEENPTNFPNDIEEDKLSYNPLMQAIVENNLREIGTNLRYAGESLSDGTTALMLAAQYNCIVAVKYLLPTEVRRKRFDGKMALDIALERGHYRFAEFLSEECIDVSDYSNSGSRVTEMMNAVSSGDLRLIWSLIPLQAGLQDEEGRTALMYAITENQMNIVQMLAPYEHKIVDSEGRTVHDYLNLFVTDRAIISQLETSLLRCSLRTNSRI